MKNATEFEIITVLMSSYFGQVHPCRISHSLKLSEWVVFHDSTNLFKPLAVLGVHRLSDHQAIFGTPMLKLSVEKAGVLKNEAPYLCD